MHDLKSIIKAILGFFVLLIVGGVVANYWFQRPIEVASVEISVSEHQMEISKTTAALKMSIAVTASVMSPEAVLFEGGSYTKSRKIGHAAILICHPRGLLMFDTGLGKNIDAQFEDMPSLHKPLFPYEVIEPVSTLVDTEAFCPGRNLEVVLSHLHWDHASGIEDLENDTPVWVPETELANGRRFENTSGYLISQFDSQDINWQTANFGSESHLSYERSLDFFGDQSVVLVPMAGHTVGSVGMFVNLGAKGVFFFTGDTTWSVEGFQRPAHKFSLMRSVVDANVSELEQEILRVHELMKQHQNLTIIPAHDHDAYPVNAIYPEFMESN